MMGFPQRCPFSSPLEPGWLLSPSVQLSLPAPLSARCSRSAAPALPRVLFQTHGADAMLSRCCLLFVDATRIPLYQGQDGIPLAPAPALPTGCSPPGLGSGQALGLALWYSPGTLLCFGAICSLLACGGERRPLSPGPWGQVETLCCHRCRRGGTPPPYPGQWRSWPWLTCACGSWLSPTVWDRGAPVLSPAVGTGPASHRETD